MSETPANKTVSTELVQLFIQLSDDLGVDRELILSSADLDPIWLERPNGKVPVEALYKLTRNLASLAENEDIGLWAGRSGFLNQTHMLRYLSSICGQFRQWLNMMPSTIESWGDIGESVVVREGNTLRTELHPTAPLEISGRYIIDLMLGTSQGMLSSVCYRPVPVLKVCFSYPEPEDTTAHREVFGAPLAFGQPFSGLLYPADALEYPIIKLRDEREAPLDGNLLNIIEKGSRDGFVRRLRRSVVRALPSGEMTIDVIAAEMAISRRTLQRRLSERELVFAGVVQELRSTMAVRLLMDKHIPITEIAFLLGYSDISSFSRAFKSWHGCSPRDFVEKS